MKTKIVLLVLMLILPIVQAETTLTCPTDGVTHSFFSTLVVIMFCLIGATFIMRKSDNFFDIITSLLAVFLSFMLSSLSINQKVYTSTSMVNSTDAVVTSYEIFNSTSTHYFFILISMIMVLYTVFAVTEILIQTYKNIIDNRYNM